MSDVKRYSFGDLKAKQESEDGSWSELHRRPAPTSQQQPVLQLQQQPTGLEAELSGVWSIMKNVNAKGLSSGGSGDGSPVTIQAGTLPGLNAGSLTNYYSRYGSPSKVAGQPAVSKLSVGGAAAAAAAGGGGGDSGGSSRRPSMPLPASGIVSGDKTPMVPKDEWKSFRTK